VDCFGKRKLCLGRKGFEIYIHLVPLSSPARPKFAQEERLSMVASQQGRQPGGATPLAEPLACAVFRRDRRTSRVATENMRRLVRPTYSRAEAAEPKQPRTNAELQPD